MQGERLADTLTRRKPLLQRQGGLHVATWPKHHASSIRESQALPKSLDCARKNPETNMALLTAKDQAILALS
jgi:hypothetical protein